MRRRFHRAGSITRSGGKNVAIDAQARPVRVKKGSRAKQGGRGNFVSSPSRGGGY